MTYKGTHIQEEQHGGRGGHVVLTATVERERTDEELDRLLDTGRSDLDDTVRRTLKVTAERRGEGFEQMKDKIDDFRDLGYR
jgi:hypothetical protein